MPTGPHYYRHNAVGPQYAHWVGSSRRTGGAGAGAGSEPPLLFALSTPDPFGAEASLRRGLGNPGVGRAGPERDGVSSHVLCRDVVLRGAGLSPGALPTKNPTQVDKDPAFQTHSANSHSVALAAGPPLNPDRDG